MRNRNPASAFDVAVQSVFQSQDFAQNLVGFAFRKHAQIFQRSLGVFHFVTTVCHDL